MPLNLLKRGEVSVPLTATQHDANLTAIENSVDSLEVGKVDLATFSAVETRVDALETKNIFSSIAVTGQNAVVADSSTDTLTLVAGTNITITTDNVTDSVTINSTGGVDSTFKTIAVAGQNDVVADTPTDTLTLVAGTGITITTDNATDTITVSGTASQNTFSTVAVAGQNDVVADSTSDTLTIVAGTGVTITTDNVNDSVTISATASVLLDSPNQFTAGQSITSFSLSAASATITTDAAESNYFRVTLSTAGPYTLANPINMMDGQPLTWKIKQDATGGRTIGTYGSKFKWAGGVVPGLSIAANAIDVLSGVYDATDDIIMVCLNRNFA